MVTEYQTFLCVLTRPAITIGVGYYDSFIHRVSPPGVSYGSGSYWLGSATGVPKEKRGLLYEMQTDGPFLCRSVDLEASLHRNGSQALACCYSYDHQSFQTGLKERDGE